MEIARSSAEVAALLERIRGRYGHSRFDRAAAIVLALAFAGMFTAGAIQNSGNWLMVLVLCAAGLLGAGTFLATKFETIEISPRGVEKSLPFLGVVWSVAAGEIRSVEVKLARGWYLRLKTDSGAKWISLWGALKTALVPR